MSGGGAGRPVPVPGGPGQRRHHHRFLRPRRRERLPAVLRLRHGGAGRHLHPGRRHALAGHRGRAARSRRPSPSPTAPPSPPTTTPSIRATPSSRTPASWTSRAGAAMPPVRRPAACTITGPVVLNVALVLDRAEDPTALLSSNWATRQKELAALTENGTLWTQVRRRRRPATTRC